MTEIDFCFKILAASYGYNIQVASYARKGLLMGPLTCLVTIKIKT